MKRIILLLVFIIVNTIYAKKQEVNVYSHRHYDTDKDLFKTFEYKTNIKVNIIQANSDALIQRMISEGANSKADVLITVDASRLYKAKSKGLLQSINSKYLQSQIPDHLRDKDNQWFGLTKRARVILVRNDDKLHSQIKTYEELVHPKYKGQIMVRSANNVYNQSLMAAVIAHYGEEKALKWAKGIVANMTKKPKGNDRYQIKAVANGIGSIAIANTYYFGKMANHKDSTERKIAKKVKIIFPKFKNGGTHINISGAGVSKYAKNKANAIKFIEFLASEEAQRQFSKNNFEYPVIQGLQPSKTVQSWGILESDGLPMDILGKNNKKAVKIFDKAGWQ